MYWVKVYRVRTGRVRRVRAQIATQGRQSSVQCSPCVLELGIYAYVFSRAHSLPFSRAQIRNFAYLYRDWNKKKFRVSATRSRPAQGYDYEPNVTITTRLDQAFDANSSRCPFPFPAGRRLTTEGSPPSRDARSPPPWVAPHGTYFSGTS